MGLRLRPVEGQFYDLFTALADHLVEGAELLAEMLGDGAGHADVAERMRDAEHRADEATHAIIKQANRTFITPFDREDIYRLASGMDDVMDAMDEAVDLTLLYEVSELPVQVIEQVDLIRRCAELTASAMPNLRSMRSLEEYWVEINRLENSGDRNHRQLLAHLFSGEYEPLDVLKLKDVVEALEQAIDAFEHVANTIEQIALKES